MRGSQFQKIQFPLTPVSSDQIGYNVKTVPDASGQRFSARCTVRGDLLRKHVHFNPDKTSAQTPSHSAHRIFYADAAINNAYVESYDVPSAYPRAPADPEFPCFMKQPLKADGTFTCPGMVFRLDGAQQGAPDAEHRWELHRNAVLKRMRWQLLASEPSAFLYHDPITKDKARLLARQGTPIRQHRRLHRQLHQPYVTNYTTGGLHRRIGRLHTVPRHSICRTENRMRKLFG